MATLRDGRGPHLVSRVQNGSRRIEDDDSAAASQLCLCCARQLLSAAGRRPGSHVPLPEGAARTSAGPRHPNIPDCLKSNLAQQFGSAGRAAY